MNLKQFCELPDVISPEQAQELNRDLSSKQLQDIPVAYRSDVEKYLCDQLMLNAVEPKYIESLDALVKDIQSNA